MWQLLALRFHLSRLFLRHSSSVQRLVIAVFVIILLSIALLIGIFAFNSFTFLHNTVGGSELMVYALFIGLTLLFSLFCLSSIATTSALAYYAYDLPFFFSLPLSPALIVREKMVENVLLSGWGVLFLGTPILISFGIVAGAGILYYLVALLVLKVLAVLAVLVGSSITIVGFRVLGRLPKAVTRAIYILLAIALLKGLQLILLPDLAHIEEVVTSGQALSITNLSSSLSHWLPSYPLALLIGGTIGLPVPLYPVVALIAGVLVMLLVFALLATRWYFSGWQLAQQYHSTPGLYRATAWFNRPRYLLEKREVVQLWREVRSAGQLVFVGIILSLYFLVLAFVRHAPGLPDIWQAFVLASLVGVAGYCLATFALRFLFPSMSLEGGASWMVWASPVSLKEIMGAKWRVGLVFMLLAALALGIPTVVALPYALMVKLLMLAHIVLLGLIIGVVQLGIGLAYPNFHESDPGTLSTTGPGLSVVVASLLIVALDSITLRSSLLGIINGGRWGTSIMIIIFLILLALCLYRWLWTKSYAKAQYYSF